MMQRSPLILIGAGGHAKVLVDILQVQGLAFDAYVDDDNKPWIDAAGVQRMSEDELQENVAGAQLVIGFVGLSCATLQRRLEIMKRYESQGANFPAIIHPGAIVSANATIESGVQIFPGAVVNSHAVVGRGSVINSGAVVEHEVQVGHGCHVAPRTVLLGAARIGECAYIGSGAVVVQNAIVPPASFIKALTIRI